MYARGTGPDGWAAEARVRGAERKPEINGTLRNARRVAKGEDPRAPCLSGQVYGDTKGRFLDGEYITTSTIVNEDGDVFTTRYSAYRVESWAADAPSKSSVIYDPPSGWRYGFPKVYLPLDGETLEEPLLRDGYPQHEIDNGGAKHCRFWESREADNAAA